MTIKLEKTDDLTFKRFMKEKGVNITEETTSGSFTNQLIEAGIPVSPSAPFYTLVQQSNGTDNFSNLPENIPNDTSKDGKEPSPEPEIVKTIKIIYPEDYNESNYILDITAYYGYVAQAIECIEVGNNYKIYNYNFNDKLSKLYIEVSLNEENFRTIEDDSGNYIHEFNITDFNIEEYQIPHLNPIEYNPNKISIKLFHEDINGNIYKGYGAEVSYMNKERYTGQYHFNGHIIELPTDDIYNLSGGMLNIIIDDIEVNDKIIGRLTYGPSLTLNGIKKYDYTHNSFEKYNLTIKLSEGQLYEDEIFFMISFPNTQSSIDCSIEELPKTQIALKDNEVEISAMFFEPGKRLIFEGEDSEFYRINNFDSNTLVIKPFSILSEYFITFDYNGGHDSNTNTSFPVDFLEGKEVIFPEWIELIPPSEDLELKCWTTVKDDLSTEIKNMVASEDTTIYAYWQEKENN